MEIEKGKLYLYEGKLEKCMSDGVIDDGLYSNKVAVYCPTKEDWDYVVSKGYDLTASWYGYSSYGLYSGNFNSSKKHYHIITIDHFKEFYPPDVEQDAYSWVNNALEAEYQNRGAILRTHTPLVNADEFNPNSEEELKEDEEILSRAKERAIEQDNINPKHYTQYKIQPINYIDANRFDFFEGNVIKYVSRYKEKNGLEDLKKAQVYLQRLIDRYEN